MFSFSWRGGSKDDDSDSTDGFPDVTNPSSASSDAAALVNGRPATQSLSRRRTWNAAFRDACIIKGTLHASVVQVLEMSDGGIDGDEIPTASRVVFWKQDGSKDLILKRFRKEIDVSPNQNNTKKAEISSIGSALYKVAAVSASLAKSATKVFWQSEDDLLMERYGVDDDHSEDIDEVVDAVVDESEPILNLELCVECLHFIRETILRHAQGDNEDIVVLPRGYSSAAAVFQAWIGRVLANETAFGSSSVQKFVEKMGLKDLYFLLEVLVDCGVVKILQRQPKLDDLLIFLLGENSSLNELKITMFDLNHQIEATQKRIDALTERKEECTQSALHCRKTKQERQAMHHMKLRKTMEEEIGKLQNIIHNLETQRLAVENAVDNGKILQVSKQTTDTLKNLRKESNEVDEIIANVQDELDQLKEVDDAIAQAANSGGIVDEDELLNELENLKLEDDDATAPPYKPFHNEMRQNETKPIIITASNEPTADSKGDDHKKGEQAMVLEVTN